VPTIFITAGFFVFDIIAYITIMQVISVYLHNCEGVKYVGNNALLKQKVTT